MSQPLDIHELRRQIDNGELKLTGTANIIESGNLINGSGEPIEYEITHGWDVVSANSCDRQWGSFNIRLFEYIDKQGYSEEQLNAVLSGMHLEHMHWDWFKKSMCYTSDRYEWFYMFADGKPQGACLIYHPKASLFDPGDIFYIEFVAIAPWNKDNLIAKRYFKGVGTLMIKCVLQFAVNSLYLRPGFSLHSLPQAIDYYEKLGMVSFPQKNKDELAYFELPRAKAVELIGVA